MLVNMKDSISTIFLLLLLLPPITFAETSDGIIAFDCPDMPTAKFQFHFTGELIALASTTRPFNTVEDIYIRIYDDEADVFDKLAQYYNENLEAKNWHKLREDSNVRLYMLSGTTAQAANTVTGIFAIVKSDEDIYLLNVVGNIRPRQIPTLLENLGELGIEISALKSLGELTFPKFKKPAAPMRLPTRFRVIGNLSVDVEKSKKVVFSIPSSTTYKENHQGHWTYRGYPIERIQIHASKKKQVAGISDGLKNGSNDITELLDGLLSKNSSVDTPKFLVEPAERSVTINAGELLDDTQPTMLTKSFRTREGELIHDIVIRGNWITEAHTIRKALEKGPEEIEKAVKALPKSVPTFEKVDLVIEEKDSKRTATITAVEKPIASRSYFDGNPLIGFNRVTGWELGTGVEFGLRKQRKNTMSYSYTISSSSETSEDDNSKLFAQIGYGFGNKQTYYRIGGRTVWGKPDSWHLGVTSQFYRATGTISPNLLSHYDSSGADFLRIFGMQDYQNYYLREGAGVTLQWTPTIPTHSFKLTLLGETHDSLHKSTDWHFFNWRSTSKARENPVTTPGYMRSIGLQYTLNTLQNRLGWHNTFSVEYSNTAFGSDFDFIRYQLHLRYAHPFGKHRLRTRAIGSFSTEPLPIQRQFFIGGPGLLSGYPLYAFAGDRGFLFNVEYLFHLPQLLTWKNWRNIAELSDADIYAVFFFNMGQTWNVVDETDAFTPKSDVGIGFQFGEGNAILRFSVAKALELEQGVQFNTVWFYSF